MSALPSDQAVRDRALDVTRSFIVRAPAGSGKTELLIQRYLALLARVSRPESVVAITFTRKAAAEMRHRVVEALAQAAGEAPREPHKQRTWELARAVRSRDQQLAWQLADNPQRLEIRTMDSLCAALVRRMPWLSRMGAPPEIAEQPQDLYRAAARAAIAMVEHEEWGTTLGLLLLHLDNDAAALEDLLVGMLARRDQWLRHLGAGREGLEETLGGVIREGLHRVRELVQPFAGEIAEALQRHAIPGIEPDELPAWIEVADGLLTKKGTWLKAILKQLPALEAQEELRLALEALRRLPPPRFDDRQWAVVEAVVQVLKLAVAQLKIEFRARRQADFIEVMEAALHALGAPEAPTDLMLALDARIEHLLVDEFQDTSLTQFRLLEALTAGWTPGDGRTLFLVGDPMQSIYRFREAEVGLFFRAEREGVGAVRLEPLRLTVNFRSDRSLIEWVNRTFPLILAKTQDIATGAVPFTASEPRLEAPAGVEVCVHPFLGKQQEEAEAQRVVEIVREAQAREPNASIAILARARTHLPVILRALREARLPYRAVEIDSLAAAPIVSDLFALTRALLHPADRIAWLAVLRAPWCGLTLADLSALVADAPEAAVWDLMQDGERVAALTPDGRARLERVRVVLAEVLAHRRRSLRAWIEAAWLALGGPACATGPADLEDAEAFLSLIEQLDEGGDLDLEALRQRLEQLYANPDPEAGQLLQVMTIHKAKGLEFDVVILPGLGRRTRADEPRLLAWLERPTEFSEGQLLLAPVPEKGDKDEPLYNYVKSVEKEKAWHEDGRLLYVAATRARRELHLLGHASVKETKDGAQARADARSLLYRLWPAVCEKFDQMARQYVPHEDRAEAVAPPRQILRRLTDDWRLPAPPPPLELPEPAFTAAQAEPEPVAYRWVGETLQHIGSVVHRMLHRIAGEGLSRWDAERVRAFRPVYRAALRELGVRAEELDAAAEKAERALLQALADPRGRWILDEAHAEAECEYALSGVLDGELISVRMDRTFVDEHGVRWIIDYKTGEHLGGSLDEFLDREVERYRPQLERYAALMARQETRPIQLGLYFPLLGAWREWGAPRVAAAPPP